MKIERVKEIYDEISKYEIKLESDPRSLGPLYLQNIISECRNFLNAVSRAHLEVHREKQDLDRSLRAAETSFKVAFDQILSNDERVRHAPSIKDREALANVILRETLNTITTLKSELLDLEYVERAVRHRHKELTATMGEIKLQRSLIRDEIDSGAMYGDERRADHERGPAQGPLGGDIDEAELDALLAKETSEGAKDDEPEAPAAPPAPVPESPPSPESSAQPVVVDEAAVKAFLEAEGSGTKATAPAADENYDEVFARL